MNHTPQPRASRRRGGLIAAALSLVALLLACGWAWRALGPNPHPADQQLIARFQQHRGEFDQLVAMFQADRGLVRVADDFTRPDDPSSVGVAPERLAAYRALFRALELDAGIEGYAAKERIWLYASTRGLSISGSAKGYAYLSQPPEQTVDDLDAAPYDDPDGLPIFRHIEGNWYLFYEST